MGIQGAWPHVSAGMDRRVNPVSHDVLRNFILSSTMRFPDSTHWKSFSQLLLVVATSLLVPALLCRSRTIEQALALKDVKTPHVLQASGGVKDTASGIALLRRENPDWVLVGNSMLNSRIDTTHLQELSGVKPFKLVASCTKSPMWFLFMKQILGPSDVKPRCVTVFFRDEDLTWPELRIRRNEIMIDHLKGREVPEWHTVMADYDARRLLNFSAATRIVSNALEELLPGEKLRTWAREEIQSEVFHLTNLGTGIRGSVRRAELNDRLSLNHQRQDAAARRLEVQEAYDLDEADSEDSDEESATRPVTFDPHPEKSFLPHMIQVARQHGFQLHFHRIKLRPSSPDDTRTPVQTAAYLHDLKQYLDREGCLFTDESTLLEITAEMFVDDGHINSTPHIQQPYMSHFWRCVQPTLANVFKPLNSEASR